MNIACLKGDACDNSTEGKEIEMTNKEKVEDEDEEKIIVLDQIEVDEGSNNKKELM